MNTIKITSCLKVRVIRTFKITKLSAGPTRPTPIYIYTENYRRSAGFIPIFQLQSSFGNMGYYHQSIEIHVRVRPKYIQQQAIENIN
jgi:hypothetical protein